MMGGKIETESIDRALEDMTIKSKAFFLSVYTISEPENTNKPINCRTDFLTCL